MIYLTFIYTTIFHLLFIRSHFYDVAAAVMRWWHWFRSCNVSWKMMVAADKNKWVKRTWKGLNKYWNNEDLSSRTISLFLCLILPYGCMYCWLILKSHRAGISGLRQHKALIIQRYQGKCVSIYKKRKLIKLNDDADDDVVVAKLGRHANKLKFFFQLLKFLEGSTQLLRDFTFTLLSSLLELI